MPSEQHECAKTYRPSAGKSIALEEAQLRGLTVATKVENCAIVCHEPVLLSFRSVRYQEPTAAHPCKKRKDEAASFSFHYWRTRMTASRLPVLVCILP
jgi:hypothetical protein